MKIQILIVFCIVFIESVVRFLTRTFRNDLYVRVGKLIVRSLVAFPAHANGRLRRLAARRVGRRRLPLPLEPRPLPPRSRPADTQTELHTNLNQRPRALFCLKLDNSWCYAGYSCGNNCNVVVKPAQEYHCLLIHFTSVLRKQFSSPRTTRFLGKQTVTSNCLR